MSSLICEVVKIKNITPHDNADRLEIIQVKGWSCISSKGKYKVGDEAVYIPIDSLIPFELSEKLGITGYLTNKIKDTQGNIIAGRVKTVKLRGILSQGLIIDKEPEWKLGDDVREILKIEKYEPPETGDGGCALKSKGFTQYPEFTGFPQYTNIENFKNFPDIFEEDEEVVILEKIHGCLNYECEIDLFNDKKEKIGKIVNDKLNLEVKGVDENNNIVSSKILNWFNNGISEKWKKIKFTRNGISGNHYGILIITENHEIFNPDLNKYIKCSDLKKDDKILINNYQKELSYIQEQVLIGKMLGDGCLSDNSIQFGHKKEHEEYIDYTLELLNDISGNKQKNIISGYGTEMCRARTVSDKSIKKLFSYWFIDSKKEVPKSIIGKLSPISLAFWYMDDGSLSHNEDQKDRALFATCGFNEESIDNLISALKYLDINSTKYKSDEYWRIRLNHEDANKLFVLISPYIPKCMQYKLPENYRLNINPIITKIKFKNIPLLTEQTIISIDDYIPTDRYKYLKTRYDIETETHNYFANGVLVHNSNLRTGNVDPFNINWKYIPLMLKMRLLLTKYLGVKNPGFFVVGTHRTNLKRTQKDKFLNVYWRMAEKYELKNKLNLGEEVFGEIYGYGIQKFFPYDSPFTQTVRFFDVIIDNQYLNWYWFKNFCERKKLPIVPILYEGPFSIEKVIELSSGKSTIGDHIREGVIIKSTTEQFHPKLGRKILKYISDEYLVFKGKMEDKLLAEGKVPELDTFSH